MPVYSADQLSKKTVFLAHDQYSGNEAENVRKQLLQCQGQMGMKCRKIEMICISDAKQGPQKIHRELDKFISDLKHQRDAPQDNSGYFGIVIVGRQSDYPGIKQVFSKLGILSQCIQKFTAKKINLSVASNVMKQINSKMGGESLRMKWPAFMKQKVMVIGIDVCHAGKKSVVGFCASTNQAQTRYYNDIIINPKNVELIKTELDRCIIAACNEFRNHHEGELPDKIIIYRDGVGE